MTLDRWIGILGVMIGVVTLVVAWLTLRATLAGVKHARVAAEASQAALDAQRAEEAAAVLSDLEQLILALVIARPDRRFAAFSEGGLSGFTGAVVAFLPAGQPFLPLRHHELEHLLSLGLIEECQGDFWEDPWHPGLHFVPPQFSLTPKGVLQAKSVNNIDVPTLIERHQVLRMAP
jgi:hypothetical protein